LIYLLLFFFFYKIEAPFWKELQENEDKKRDLKKSQKSLERLNNNKDSESSDSDCSSSSSLPEISNEIKGKKNSSNHLMHPSKHLVIKEGLLFYLI
jgi:hypothetical protein